MEGIQLPRNVGKLGSHIAKEGVMQEWQVEWGLGWLGD